MKDSLERIGAMPKEIGMVKMADRIANLRPPPSLWNTRRIAEYGDEARIILEAIGNASPYFQQRLEIKIVEYRLKFLSQG